MPGYEEMLDTAAECLRAVEADSPVVVDLGVGSGALAARCAAIVSNATIVGVDEDRGMLALARERLAQVRATLLEASFLTVDLPECDAVVASLALHHVASLDRKAELYGRIARALRSGGMFVTADCFPPSDARLAQRGRDAWRAHLRATYSDADTDRYFAAWAEEDTYVPLDDELAMMRRAGLRSDVIWRHSPMAVIAARKPRS